MLKRIFRRLGAETITAIITASQGKQQARRLRFFYEWLSGERLQVEDASFGLRYLQLLDPECYFTGPPRQSPRHKITNILPGNPNFCPVVRKTGALKAFTEASLSFRIEQVMDRTSQDIWHRAASFLLLADSRASFAITTVLPDEVHYLQCHDRAMRAD